MCTNTTNRHVTHCEYVPETLLLKSLPQTSLSGSLANNYRRGANATDVVLRIPSEFVRDLEIDSNIDLSGRSSKFKTKKIYRKLKEPIIRMGNSRISKVI